MTGEVASTARAMTVAEAEAVAERADAAFSAWSATGPNARRALLTKAADALQAKAPAFAEAMMAETGATFTTPSGKPASANASTISLEPRPPSHQGQQKCRQRP